MRGRLAKTMSCLERHSSAAEGEEIIRTGREPSFRRSMGPYLFDMWIRVRWRGLFLRR